VLKVTYYTSGRSGIGRLVHGIAIYNAFERRDIEVDFKIISSAPPERLYILENISIDHIQVPQENHVSLSAESYTESSLFNAIIAADPDILIVDRMWFTLREFIRDLPCKKIYITIQVYGHMFHIELPNQTLHFDREQYDRVIAIEPFSCSIEMEQVHPLIIRNRNEILTREKALETLGLSGEKKIGFLGMNFEPGYFEELAEKYGYLEEEGYDMVYSTNLQQGGIFPIADCYNAIDLVVSAATYNQFWETRYFEKEGIFETVPVRFCDQARRLRECSDYTFEENGADQLADIIMNM
jgi:hypothetical protein